MLPKHIMMREELFGTSGHCSLSMTLEVRRVGGWSGGVLEKENEIKDCLCVSARIFKPCFCGCCLQSCSLLPPLVAPAQTYWFFLQFCVRTPAKTSGDGETGGKDTSVCRRTHTHRAAVLAGPLFPLLLPQTCIGDILQYTFYEPFPSHQCSRPAQPSVGESYGVVFSRLCRTDPTPRRSAQPLSPGWGHSLSELRFTLGVSHSAARAQGHKLPVTFIPPARLRVTEMAYVWIQRSLDRSLLPFPPRIDELNLWVFVFFWQ